MQIKEILSQKYSYGLLKNYDGEYRYREKNSCETEGWVRPITSFAYLGIAVLMLAEITTRVSLGILAVPIYVIGLATSNKRILKLCSKYIYNRKFDPIFGKTSLLKVTLLVISSFIQLFETIPFHYCYFNWDKRQFTVYLPSQINYDPGLS